MSTHLRGRLIFRGFLGHDTAHEIADAMRSVLDGQRYVFVADNELFSEAEVRVNCELRDGVSHHAFGDAGQYVSVRFSDDDYITSITTSATTPEVAALDVRSLDRVQVTVYESGVRIVQTAGMKNRIVWTLIPTGPVPAEVTS